MGLLCQAIALKSMLDYPLNVSAIAMTAVVTVCWIMMTVSDIFRVIRFFLQIDKAFAPARQHYNHLSVDVPLTDVVDQLHESLTNWPQQKTTEVKSVKL